MDKPWVLFSSCCWCVAIIIIIVGAFMLDDALEENEQHEETTCSIESISPNECQYECNCHKEYNRFRAIMEEICELCDAHTYKYQVSADICNANEQTLNIQNSNQGGGKNKRRRRRILLNDDDDSTVIDSEITVLLNQEGDDHSGGDCGQQIKKDIGEDYQCYVDCDNKQYTFSNPSVSITTSIILLSVGGVICLCGAIPPFVIKS